MEFAVDNRAIFHSSPERKSTTAHLTRYCCSRAAEPQKRDTLLTGISPLLTGPLLMHLDEMGHSDSVLVADAHFPSARLARRFVDLPGTTATDVVAAIRTVLPLDDDGPLDLMATPDGTSLPIHSEIAAAARIGTGEPRFVDRFAFYELAATASVIVRTGERRTYANALLRKGIVAEIASNTRTS